MNKLNKQLQTVADGYTNQALYAGIGWHITQAGETIANGTSGFADEHRKAPLAEDAIYRIYSMTKPIVSFMAMMLIERGQLRLSDFVAQYIPAFATTQVLGESTLEPPARPMTIEDLLTHRSGLSYDFVPDCPIAQQYAASDLLNRVEKSLEEFADLIASFPLAFHPGSQWRYSFATDILARVLEVASGETIDALLEEAIFAPLDMIDTAYSVPDSKQGRLLPLFGLEKIDLSFTTPPPHDLLLLDAEAIYPSRPGHNTLRGGLGLFSTCADYSKFANMLLTGQTPDGRSLISPAMHRLMRSNRIPKQQMPLMLGPIPFPGYGFCLIGRVMQDVGQAMSLTVNGEFGWEGAAGTYFWVDPANQVVGVLMTQYLSTYLPMRDDMRTAVYAGLN